MSSSRRLGDLATLAGVGVLYVVAGKLGLKLAFVNASASAVWPPTGIALAALLIVGNRAWLPIFAGAFVVNVSTTGALATSLGIATGNTLEGLAGAYLVRRFAGGRQAFERARDVFAFSILAPLLSTVVSATFGVSSLTLGDFARWSDYGPIWLTWWLGDATGGLIVAPLLLLWAARPRARWSRSRMTEAAILALGLLLVGQFVFGDLSPLGSRRYPLAFLCLPFLVWAAFRLGPRAAATAIALLSGIATWGTLRGFGPFARTSPNESLLLLQAFMGVTAVMILALAAVVAERNQIEKQLRELAVTDPLTGLGNHRLLVGALESEIRRSLRSGRPFAVLFLDVDGLKRINDRHGHLVGSRALFRVGEALRNSCRATDTAARYGGDEFALVLPETGESEARNVADRLRKLLVLDGERPRVSVSVGQAVYPHDGDTAESLLGAADRLLYGEKARGGALGRFRGEEER